MNLRLIVIVLAALALMTSAVNVYFQYTALKKSVQSGALKEAEATLKEIDGQISTFVAEQAKPVRILAGLPVVGEFINDPTGANLEKVNVILDHFDKAMEGSICFLIDLRGTIIASSNRSGSDHLPGENLFSLPYFQSAFKGQAGIYMGYVKQLEQRAVFNSFPVMNEPGGLVTGVAAIRTTVDNFRKNIAQSGDEIILVVAPNGIVFASSHPAWRFTTFEKLSSAEEAGLVKSGLFGNGPFKWSGLEKKGKNIFVDRTGLQYLGSVIPISSLEGWKLVHLENLNIVLSEINETFFAISNYPLISMTLFVAVCVLIIYRRASTDILKRQVAEQALLESQEKHRNLYRHTPGMLHAIDPDGVILTVSDHWLKTLGYSGEQVIGKNFTEFLSDHSRTNFQEVSFPQLRNAMVLSNTSVELKRHNGILMETLLSASADRDGLGRIYRYLCVLTDVTHQKRLETELSNVRKQPQTISQQ